MDGIDAWANPPMRARLQWSEDIGVYGQARATQRTMLSHMGAYPSQATNGGGHQCGPQSGVKTAERPRPYSPATTSGSSPTLTTRSASPGR